MPRIFRNPDVLWRREAEEGEVAAEEEAVAGILFSGGSMLSLNDFGFELWEMCEGRTAEEMTALLLPEFDVEEALLLSDIRDFLESLSQKGFIRYE